MSVVVFDSNTGAYVGLIDSNDLPTYNFYNTDPNYVVEPIPVGFDIATETLIYDTNTQTSSTQTRTASASEESIENFMKYDSASNTIISTKPIAIQ